MPNGGFSPPLQASLAARAFFWRAAFVFPSFTFLWGGHLLLKVGGATFSKLQT